MCNLGNTNEKRENSYYIAVKLNILHQYPNLSRAIEVGFLGQIISILL